MNFIKNIITAHISYCKIAFSFQNKILPIYALIVVCLLLFTRCIISQNSLKYPYMLPSENLNFSNRSYRFHVETSYITLNIFLRVLYTNLLPFISTVTVLCCDLWELLQYGFFNTIYSSSFSYRRCIYMHHIICYILRAIEPYAWNFSVRGF